MGPAHSLGPCAQPLHGPPGGGVAASVFSVTRSVPQTSNAWVSSSSLHSALMPVRWADAAYQVLPISATDGGWSSEGAGPRPTPGGQGGG